MSNTQEAILAYSGNLQTPELKFCQNETENNGNQLYN